MSYLALSAQLNTYIMGNYKYFHSFSVGTLFIRQNLTSTASDYDVKYGPRAVMIKITILIPIPQYKGFNQGLSL